MLPVETLRAIYPPHGAPTLAHVAALEALGVALEEPIAEDKAPLALWVLTLPAGRCAEVVKSGYAGFAFKMWSLGFGLRSRARGLTPAKVAARVEAILSDAFSTIIPPHTEGKTERVTPTGLGWPLEMAEWYMAEYGATFDEAFRVPLARLFALIAAARKRNGGEHGGPDYYERITLAEMRLEEMKEKANG